MKQDNKMQFKRGDGVLFSSGIGNPVRKGRVSKVHPDSGGHGAYEIFPASGGKKVTRKSQFVSVIK